MLKRFLTGIVIIAVTVGFFALRYVSPYIFDVYLGALVILSTYEVSRSFFKNKNRNDLYFVLAYPVLVYVALFLCVRFGLNILIFYAISIGILVLIFGISFLLNLMQKNRMNKEMIEVDYVGTYQKYSLKKSMTNLLVMLYPTFVLLQLFVLNHLSGFSNFASITGKNIEVFLLIMVFVTTMLTDTGAYLLGSGIGGKKLCPTISPNKTIAGAVGGVVISVTFSVLLFILFSAVGYASTFNSLSITLIHFIIYGFVSSIFTQGGDILASYTKRRNNIKDFGNLLPGHGGVMDRVDGLMFNAFATLIISFILFM